jgi:hypothetical protein
LASRHLENTMSEEILRAAREYLLAGLHIIFLTGKRPNPKYHPEWSWDNSVHGSPETPEEEEDLAAAVGDPTVTGIAILIPQNVLVADIDSDRAAAVYSAMAGIPDTRVAKTPHGMHVWFIAPGASSSIWLGDEQDGRALLFKGPGGYVVAPPSVNDEGERYEWIGEWREIDWLPDAISEKLEIRKALDGLSSPYPPSPAPRSLVPVFASGRWAGGFAKIDMDGLCRSIVDAADGNQNNVIYWAACAARDDGVPLMDAYKALLGAAVEGNHPADRARGAIRSAYKARGSVNG